MDPDSEETRMSLEPEVRCLARKRECVIKGGEMADVAERGL
jgi:hypothetical protein